MDASLSPLLWLLFSVVGLQVLPSLLFSPFIGFSSFVSGDVIGAYALANKHQCDRLCGYRKPCSGYRYSSSGFGSGEALGSNCILLAGSGSGDATPASLSSISKGCKKRPCGQDEVCVPMPSLPVPTSPNSADYVCLPVPIQCGDPDPVPSADVIVRGRRQDDVAKVVCEEGFAFPSGYKSLQITCLATSEWTKVEDHCIRYEFRGCYDGHKHFGMFAPVEDQQKLCVKGVFEGNGQMYINLQEETLPNGIHISFRQNYYRDTSLFWSRKEGTSYRCRKDLGDMPLTPGDRFNLSLHMDRGDMVTLKLNQTLIYTIQLNSVQHCTVGLTTSNIKRLELGGQVKTAYFNLLSLC